MRCLICEGSCIYLKEQNEWIFFVFIEMHAQFVIYKPVADVWKYSIQLLFYYIDVVMLKNKTCVINIMYKLTIHSLHDITLGRVRTTMVLKWILGVLHNL